MARGLMRARLLRCGMGLFLLAAALTAANVLLLPFARACYGYGAGPAFASFALALGAFLLLGRALARADEGACAGVHCNRKIGPTMEFGCRPNERATVFRVGVAPNGEYRLFILTGSILDEPKQYFGTSMVVRVDGDVSGVLKQALRDGWEPHFAVAYGDIQAELEMLGHMLDIPVMVYSGAS